MFEEFENKNPGLILNENTISDDDYMLGDINDMDYFNNIQADKPQFYYNQAAQKRTQKACTLYGAIGLISDLYGYEFSLEEILEICDLAEAKYGRRENFGGYLHKAIDCVRNYWNEKYPEKEIVSFRVDLLSEGAKKLINAGKTINIGYKTSVAHLKDSQDNGIMDIESFIDVNKTGGHAIRFSSNLNIDNYIDKKKFNTYVNEKLKQYVEEGTYFRYGYVYFQKQESLFKDLLPSHPFYKQVKYLKDKGIINGYNDGTIRLENNLTRGEFFAVIANILQNQSK